MILFSAKDELFVTNKQIFSHEKNKTIIIIMA
uniref:Uncharacterized protein n=1 Tax=Lepeophtheirus salmonis TaxID=72036 RepID=A0A0K2TP15_LEPSM